MNAELEALIPVWAYGQTWKRYRRYCTEKMLPPFSEVAFAIWRQDYRIPFGGESTGSAKLDVVKDILDAANRRS